MSEFEIVWRIVVPSAWPAIAAFSVFSVVAHWNDLYWPLIVISDTQARAAAARHDVLRRCRDRLELRRADRGATIITAPLVIAFLFARRRFIAGITMTGIK